MGKDTKRNEESKEALDKAKNMKDKAKNIIKNLIRGDSDKRSKTK